MLTKLYSARLLGFHHPSGEIHINDTDWNSCSGTLIFDGLGDGLVLIGRSHVQDKKIPLMNALMVLSKPFSLVMYLTTLVPMMESRFVVEYSSLLFLYIPWIQYKNLVKF